MMVEEVERALNGARSRFNISEGEARAVFSRLRAATEEVGRLSHRIEYLDKLSALLNSYADERQTIVQSQIEGIVTQGLRSIFEENFTFKIVNRQVGHRSEIDFVLVSESGGQTLETSILEARGGGVAAVAGFLVQATLVLLTPNLTPTLFLDEVFSQVSVGYLEPLSEFIKELTEKSDLQVVLVTHSEVFGEAADAVYHFSQSRGITTVRKEA